MSRDASLEYLERYRILPNEVDVSGPWAAGEASYLGTTLMSGQPFGPGVVEELLTELAHLADVRAAAADMLDDRVLLVRLLSASGPAFHAARRRTGDRVATH